MKSYVQKPKKLQNRKPATVIVEFDELFSSTHKKSCLDPSTNPNSKLQKESSLLYHKKEKK